MVSKQKQRKFWKEMGERMREVRQTSPKWEVPPLKIHLTAEEYLDYRRSLIEKVKTGELRPQDAERIAAENYDEPFSDIPSSYSDLATVPPVWTPEMVAIWYQTRDARAVRRHHRPSCENRFVWVANGNRFPPRRPRRHPGEPHKVDFSQRCGHDLVLLEATTLSRVFTDFDGRTCVKFPAVDSWLEPLRASLLNGTVSAFGFSDKDRSLIRPIDEADWVLATFETDVSGGTVLKVGDRHKLWGVVLNAEDIVIDYQWPLLKWKEQPEEVSGMGRSVLNSLKNHWPFGLPVRSLASKELATLIPYLSEIHQMRWKSRHEEFGKFLRPKLKRVCVVPATASG